MADESDIPDRVQALLDQAARRRAARAETRAVFAERRRHGLARRHARKLTRAGVRPAPG